jgi:hypothetical protein
MTSGPLRKKIGVAIIKGSAMTSLLKRSLLKTKHLPKNPLKNHVCAQKYFDQCVPVAKPSTTTVWLSVLVTQHSRLESADKNCARSCALLVKNCKKPLVYAPHN